MSQRRLAQALAVLATPVVAIVVALGAASAASTTPTTTAYAPPTAAFAASMERTTLTGPATIVAGGTRTRLPALPHVTAGAYMVYDTTDHQLLAARNTHQSRAIASLTKMMTAMVVITRDQPADPIAISSAAVATDDGSALGMTAGQRYPTRELLPAMLVHSANDAAQAFAEHSGYTTFIAAMNTKATQLGMLQTHFTSPHGLDSVHGNRSTAADVLVLARAAMAVPAFRAAVRTRSVHFTRPDGTATDYPNRNSLLGSYPGVDGIKTGFTDAAGECLVTHLHNASGDDVYVVVLGSSSEATRDSDSRALLTWARSTRVRVVAVAKNSQPATVPTSDDGGTLRLRIPVDLATTTLIGRRLTVTAELPTVVSGPIVVGQQIGWLDLNVGGERVSREPLLATRAVAAHSVASRIGALARRVRTAWSVGFRAVT